MNAGAFGSEIWQFVDSVTTINTKGLVFERSSTDFNISYRQVLANNNHEYFVAARFKFEKIKKQKISKSY